MVNKQRNKKVLTIAHNNLIHFQLKEILSNIDKTMIIRQAFSYKEADDLFSHFLPDTVFIDKSLFDGSSLFLVQLFKIVNPKVKVILMVHSPTTDFIRRCLELGVDDFFEKSNICILFNYIDQKLI